MKKAKEDTPFDAEFGVRLRAARKMAGMSMEDLASKMGGMVTKQAISKYERGLMMPSPEVRERLEQVLDAATQGVSPLGDAVLGLTPEKSHEPSAVYCYISEAGRDEIPDRSRDAAPVRRSERFPSLAERRARYLEAWEAGSGAGRIRFREGQKLPARSASMLKHRLADYLQRCLGLEALLGTPSGFENPIRNLPVGSPTEVETAAVDVRRRWDLGSGPIVNLLGLLEDRGIRVFETRGIEGFEGLSGTFGAEPAVPFIAVSRDFPDDRVRFTAAHELAHILCGFPESEGEEDLCHRFAGALLLPESAAEKAFSGGPRRRVTLGELAEIKAAFGISLQAVMYRARALGLISGRRLRAFRETVKARGWSVVEPVDFSGAERASRFRNLVRRAVASGVLDVDRASKLAGIPAEEIRDEIGELF